MKPGLDRGDILFLQNSAFAGGGNDIQVGDIVVFSIQGRPVPIVHRVIRKIPRPTIQAHVSDTTGAASSRTDDNDWLFLTKGDFNRFDDRGLYADGQGWITRQDIQGKVVGVLRYLGFVTILLNDYPVVKYVLLGLMGWFAFSSGE